MTLTQRDLDLLIEVYKHMNAEGSRPDLAAALGRVVRRKAAPYLVRLVLKREQVESDIPYQLVCETKNSARWDTFTRKRRWAEEFTSKEQTAATSLFWKANQWALHTGVPDTVRMTEVGYDLWQKLGDFCASLYEED